MICPGDGPTEERHDTIRPDGRQENKINKKSRDTRAQKQKQNKAAFLCPAGGARMTQESHWKAETQDQKIKTILPGIRAIAKNGSSRSVLGQKRVGTSTKAANTQFGLT